MAGNEMVAPSGALNKGVPKIKNSAMQVQEKYETAYNQGR